MEKQKQGISINNFLIFSSQYMETKVPSHLLEHMAVPSSSSVRSRFLNPEMSNTQKKSLDLFSSAIAQHKPVSIL